MVFAESISKPIGPLPGLFCDTVGDAHAVINAVQQVLHLLTPLVKGISAAAVLGRGERFASLAVDPPQARLRRFQINFAEPFPLGPATRILKQSVAIRERTTLISKTGSRSHQIRPECLLESVHLRASQ